MMKRRLICFVVVLVMICLLPLVAIGYWRVLQDYHRKILNDPQQFGIFVREYEGPQKTPCLMVEPSAAPGEAKKGRAARELLARKGQTLRPWGEVRGTLILLHGRSGRKEDHLPIAERFCAAGFRCVIPDLPGHGDNPEKLATFGKKRVWVGGGAGR